MQHCYRDSVLCEDLIDIRLRLFVLYDGTAWGRA